VTTRTSAVRFAYRDWNGHNLNPFARIDWRTSLVPAPAVIPAPIVYIKVVAVKTLVVGPKEWRSAGKPVRLQPAVRLGFVPSGCRCRPLHSWHCASPRHHGGLFSPGKDDRPPTPRWVGGRNRLTPGGLADGGNKDGAARSPRVWRDG